MDPILILIIAGTAIAVISTIIIFNKLIARRNQVENTYSSIDVIFKQRHDLIPNLIASTKAYMQHERDTLEHITKLREEAETYDLTDDEKIHLEGQLSGAIRSIVMKAEAYPDLKASANFVQLQKSLNEVEERLSAARRAYNSSVTMYNNDLEQFPSNMVAAMMGLRQKEWFEATEMERSSVSVADAFGV